MSYERRYKLHESLKNALDIDSMHLLQGKRALVCGSTQGIGRAIALHFADLGADVVLLARDPAALEVVADQLNTEIGQRHAFIVADFSYPDALRQTLVERISDIQPLHILVNNTGGPPGGLIRDADENAFLEAFSKHLICNQILAQSLIPGMKQASFGRIINIISTSVRQPIPGLGVSNTIRGAVASWSKTLAGELAPFGITVNNILPGATETARLASIIDSNAEKLNISSEQAADDMKQTIPMGRFAEPLEIAQAAGFLASDWAAYITGISLPVDGGRLSCL